MKGNVKGTIQHDKTKEAFRGQHKVFIHGQLSLSYAKFYFAPRLTNGECLNQPQILKQITCY